MTRTMDPRTNKRMRTKSGKPGWSPDGKRNGTTGKGSGSVGKDRKRVPAGVPLTVHENWNIDKNVYFARAFRQRY